MRLHDLWRICPSEAPYYIACSISYMGADTVIAFVDIVDQSLLQNRNINVKPIRQEKATSAKLGEGEAATMPRAICFTGGK